MLPQSLLTFTATLLFPLLTAASNPVCQSSNHGTSVANFTNFSIDFCNKLAYSNFISDIKMYDVQNPIILFDFAAQSSPSMCNLTNCLERAATLALDCERDSHSIYGSGSIDLGCGTYNFTISPQNSTVVPTTPVSTNATATGKPKVGSTVLGTSGGAIIKGSGCMFLMVACGFAWFL